MPGCGEPQESIFEPTDHSKLVQGVENFREEWSNETKNRAAKRDAENTNPPFVRDLTVTELEALIEKAVRRVIQGEDIKREWAKLEALREALRKK